MRTIVVAFCLSLVLVFAGCGKKDSDKTKKVAFASSESVKLADSSNDIPTVEYEDAKFFEEDDIADFAFIDDEDTSKLNDKDSVELAANLAEELSSALESDEALAWEEDEESSVFKAVNFDLNGNNIRKDQKESVKANIEAAKELVEQGKSIVITGNTCEFGSASFNLSLSEKRAKTIKDEMVRSGVSESKIKVLGIGSESPVVVSDATDRAVRIKELAPNRRAEITIS